nr:hypothetical protein [Tanacetum cinerariifolium]
MTILAEFIILAVADNRPPMLEKSLYNSWKSRMEFYMENRENGRMILNAVQNGPLVLPTITEDNGTTRKKTYAELSTSEKLQADCDCKATNIVLQGLPSDVYAIVNHHKVTKEIGDRVKLLMHGTKLSLHEKEYMKEDHKIPIILGRLFLATTHTMIDVFNNKISFKVRNETVTFDIEKSMKFSSLEEDTCLSIDMVDLTILNHAQEVLPSYPMDSFLFKPIINYQEGKIINLWKDDNDEADQYIDSGVFSNQNNEEPTSKTILFTANTKEYEKQISKLNELLSNLEAKVDVIAKLPYLTNIKGVRSLWDECIQAFNILKDKLTTTPVIIAPDWNLDFELMCDASDYGVGAVLGQRIYKKFRLIYYINEIIRRCVFKKELQKILEHCHMGPAGGHYGVDITARKADKLDDALWTFKIAYKSPIGSTLFRIIYGKACHLPIEIEHKAYWALRNVNLDLDVAGKH